MRSPSATSSKADLAKFKAAADDKAASDAKRKTTIDTLATQLKPGLEALGATVVAEPGALDVSFPADKMIDANGIDVSDGGMAAIKILAEATKKEGAKVRIRARSSAAAPPKELRSLFRTAGEMNAVRAARVMSSLQNAGRRARAGHHRRRRRTRAGRARRAARNRALLRRTGSSSRSSPSNTCAAAGAWRCSRSSQVSAAVPRPAAAYDFTVGLRTIGQGYQVRRFGADGNNELLSRRRLTQYMDLAVFDLAPARWRGDDGDRNLLYFDASLRFDSDFGGYMLGRPTGSDEIQELKQSQLDILYAFLGGRNVGGRVDFQLGRQIHFDLVDFFAFDGGDAIVHVTRNFAVQAYAGTEVRGELPLSAPIYEIDGTSAGSRDPATRPGQASALRPLVGAAVLGGRDGGPLTGRLAYRRVWSATVDRLPGEPD